MSFLIMPFYSLGWNNQMNLSQPKEWCDLVSKRTNLSTTPANSFKLWTGGFISKKRTQSLFRKVSRPQTIISPIILKTNFKILFIACVILLVLFRYSLLYAVKQAYYRVFELNLTNTCTYHERGRSFICVDIYFIFNSVKLFRFPVRKSVNVNFQTFRLNNNNSFSFVYIMPQQCYLSFRSPVSSSIEYE